SDLHHLLLVGPLVHEATSGFRPSGRGLMAHATEGLDRPVKSRGVRPEATCSLGLRRQPPRSGDPMRNPKDFFRPLAAGAPEPLREIPTRPSRMIHFFDPSNEKMAAKVPDIAAKVDIILGNLEDAIKAENKDAARNGLVTIAKATDFGDTQLWTRVNSLDSPWILDDLTTLVTEIGD